MIRFSVVVFFLLLPLQAGEHWSYVAPQKADVPATVNAVDSLLDAARKNAGVEAAGRAGRGSRGGPSPRVESCDLPDSGPGCMRPRLQ